MPNNRRSTLKKIKGKETVHPGSRKAAQITRVHLRKAKLESAKKSRKDLVKGKLYRPLFFMQQLESAEPLSLPQLHELVSRAFIGRNDARMAELESERRPGRPKAKEHLDLEELKRVEESEYASGFEVFDLTNPKATRLLYMMIENNKRFKQSHVDLFPQVRISSRQPEVVVASRPGQVEKMGLGGELPDILMGGDDDDEDEMDEE